MTNRYIKDMELLMAADIAEDDEIMVRDVSLPTAKKSTVAELRTRFFNGVVIDNDGRVFIGGGSANPFRSDTGLEILQDPDAGIGIIQGSNPGGTSTESFIAFGGYDGVGSLWKTASISSHFISTDHDAGYASLRLNACYAESAVRSDDVAISIYGHHGINFWGSNIGPGPGNKIIAIDGQVIIGANFPTLTRQFSIYGTDPTLELRRIDNTGNAAIEYRTGTTQDWVAGTRGISDSNFHLYSFALSADAITIEKTNGTVGIGDSSPTLSDGAGLVVGGKIIRLKTTKTPASAGATGNAGEFCWDTNYVYVCTSTNTWKRAALATW